MGFLNNGSQEDPILSFGKLGDNLCLSKTLIVLVKLKKTKAKISKILRAV